MMKRKASAALIAATSAAVSKRQAAKKKVFLRELAKLPNVAKAAAKAHVDRTTIYLWRRDPDFAKAWQSSLDQGVSKIEDEALEFGSKRPPDGSSSMSAWVNMVTFLLKSHRPEVYRERQEIGVLGGFIYVPVKEEKNP